MEKAKQEYQVYVTDYLRRGAMREMPDDERQTIIEGQPCEVRVQVAHRSIFRLEETMGRCSS
jgi:hypothetical protein